MKRPGRTNETRKVALCNIKGFTFVETLIAFSITGIFLALTWATVNFLLMKAGEQIERTRAHFLAVEGVELLKQIRQTSINRNRQTGFLEEVGDKNGAYVLKKDGEEYVLNPGQNEPIEMNEEPYTTYCRTVDFTGAKRTAKTATVTVRWGDPENCSLGEQSVAYSTLLNNF